MSFLRTETIAGEYDHVLEMDPAFDQEAKTFKDAFRVAFDTGDFSGVPRRDGGPEPVVWRLRHLTDEEWRYVTDVMSRVDGGLDQACYHAVALALVGVTGLPGFEVEREPDLRRRGWPAVKRELLAKLSDDVINGLGVRVVASRGPRRR